MFSLAKKRFWKDRFFIAAGCFLISAGMNIFLVPNQISSGGLSTFATVLLYLFKIPLSVTNLIFNIILFFFGIRFLGKAAVKKTIMGVLFLSFFLEATLILPPYTENIFVSSITGGFLVGSGLGLVIRREASTGGSDFLGLMLKKFFPHIPTATLILFIDCTVIIISGIIFKSLTVMLLSLASMYVAAKLTDAIITMGDLAKSVFIVSSKSEEISENLLKHFDRGLTGIYSKGIYSGEKKMMLLCVTSPKEVPQLIRSVRIIDNNAFIIISDVREVLGEGFKLESVYDK